jgi:hypothetical protein
MTYFLFQNSVSDVNSWKKYTEWWSQTSYWALSTISSSFYVCSIKAFLCASSCDPNTFARTSSVTWTAVPNSPAQLCLLWVMWFRPVVHLFLLGSLPVLYEPSKLCSSVRYDSWRWSSSTQPNFKVDMEVLFILKMHFYKITLYYIVVVFW